MSTIQSISTKDLRNNLSEILEEVAIGKKTFVVYKFGRKKALITPLKALESKQVDFKKLEAYGIWSKRLDIQDASLWIADLRQKQSKRWRE